MLFRAGLHNNEVQEQSYLQQSHLRDSLMTMALDQILYGMVLYHSHAQFYDWQYNFKGIILMGRGEIYQLLGEKILQLVLTTIGENLKFISSPKKNFTSK